MPDEVRVYSDSVQSMPQGIVGGTYDRYLEGEAAVSKPEDQLFIQDDVSPTPDQICNKITLLMHTCSTARWPCCCLVPAAQLRQKL